MVFVTTSDYNTVDHIYVKKHVNVWDPKNEHSDIANKYISSLKMTHVSRNM